MAGLKRRDFVISAGVAAAAAVSGSAKRLIAEDSPRAELSYVNVKDFGARGNGQADDTAAIKRALDAAHKKTMGTQFPGSVYYASIPEIFFPAGVYKLSDTVKLGSYDRVRGTGNARIEMQSPEKDIFVFDGAYKNKVEGVCLAGGRRHISFFTHNLDTSNIIIKNCQLFGSSDFSVYTDGCNSTFMKIEGCVFLECMQVFRGTCDKAVLSDTWITTARGMKDKAAIENRGALHLERVLGVPLVNGTDQRWVDNYGSVSCIRVRFGGEGAGFTAVNNYRGYDYTYPVIPSWIVMENCDVYCLGNKKRKCVVYLNQIPNIITIKNCHGSVDEPLIMVDEKIDLDTYFDNARKRVECCRYTILNNTVNELWTQIPEQMRPWQTGLNHMKGSRPKSGHWLAGDVVVNANPKDLGPFGWSCVEAGKPGKWQDVGIASNLPTGLLDGEPMKSRSGSKWLLKLPNFWGWSALVTVIAMPKADDKNVKGHRTVAVGVLTASTAKEGTKFRNTLTYSPLQNTAKSGQPLEVSAHFGGLEKGPESRLYFDRAPDVFTITAEHGRDEQARLRMIQLG